MYYLDDRFISAYKNEISNIELSYNPHVKLVSIVCFINKNINGYETNNENGKTFFELILPNFSDKYLNFLKSLSTDIKIFECKHLKSLESDFDDYEILEGMGGGHLLILRNNESNEVKITKILLIENDVSHASKKIDSILKKNPLFLQRIENFKVKYMVSDEGGISTYKFKCVSLERRRGLRNDRWKSRFCDGKPVILSEAYALKFINTLMLELKKSD